MLSKTRIISLTLLLALALFSQPALAGEGASTEVLLKTNSSWDGTLYGHYPEGEPELTMLRIIIPAETALAWHTHPMPNAAYVVRGELTVINYESGETKTLIGGQVLPEMVGLIHRGHSGADPVELIVFYAGAQGLPLSEPALTD